MRCAWTWVVLAACSSAPAEEQLPAGPPRSPRTCKDADLVATMQDEHASKNQALVQDAFAAFETAHGLGEDEAQPRGLPIDEIASLRLPRTDGVFEDGGRWFLSDRDVDHGKYCEVIVHHSDRLAHGTDGAPVLVEVMLARETGDHVEQCGSCTVSCGQPWSDLPLVWALPVAVAPTVLDAGTVTLDELEVTCEREVPAQ